jgi:plastocyanin
MVSGLGFEPATLTVHDGDQITWENTDLIVHTVTAGDHGFDSGDLAGGHSWSIGAKQRGTFNYACRYHPNMKGTLIVR